MNTTHTGIVIAGCGDIGRRLAHLWMEEGYPVTGIVKSGASASRLKDLGIQPVQTDLDRRNNPDLPSVNAHILYYLAPPPRGGGTDPRVRRFLAGIPQGEVPTRLIYMSTSGVYGDTGGEWVTENSPLNPGTDRSRRRADAEAAVRTWCRKHRVRFNILRVPGIYGPGRIRLERLQNREPVLRRRDAPWSNRIHADDLARICLTVEKRGKPNTVYNAGDGNPTSVAEFYFTLADLLGWGHPPTITMEEARESMSEMRLSFLEESRRLDCSRLKNELHYEYLYPTIAAGLKATLTEMGYPVRKP